MKQYLQLLRDIKSQGTLKPAAREGMPGTLSLFGYQYKHDLASGFPLLTTKKMPFKWIVTELMWFLRGDTNIKYLDERGVTGMWHEDAYNYYVKIYNQRVKEGYQYSDELLTFEGFCQCVKYGKECATDILKPVGYEWGDCGEQYGHLWRRFLGSKFEPNKSGHKFILGNFKEEIVDQISALISSLRNNPESRRHIVTAWNPATLDDMALNACHILFQCNCRPIDFIDRCNMITDFRWKEQKTDNPALDILESTNVPKYYLDLRFDQRSADVLLGVPFNLASYALLCHILAKMCNMIPGIITHQLGDVHIYENHFLAVDEQLEREPKSLPKLQLSDLVPWNKSIDEVLESIESDRFSDIFGLEDYNPHPKLVNDTSLSTGLKK